MPPPQTWIPNADAFGATASALAAVGLPTHAWVVLDHVDSLPEPFPKPRPEPYVVNAFGDRYPWALCPSNQAVLDYAVDLATAVAVRPDVSGVEFEAAGWYGFDHLHQHDKVSGVALNQAEQFLLSLCFCEFCDQEYKSSDIDPGQLRSTVRAYLDLAFHGDGTPSPPRNEGAEICEALGDVAEPVLAMRLSVANRLREALVREVRSYRPEREFPVVFHGNPRPHRSTAFTGLDPAALPEGTTGVVVNCWDGQAENVALAASPGLKVLAGMLGIRGHGARPEKHAEILAAVRTAGASGIRIYHAGLASAADLAAMRELVAAAHVGVGVGGSNSSGTDNSGGR